MTAREVDDLVPQASEAVDAYELSPTQTGMLLHNLRDPRGGLFIEQMVLRLTNPDIDAFERAWQHLVDRHDALRTSFHWDGPHGPRQAVAPTATLPIERLDWRDTGAPQQHRRLNSFLLADRHRAFDLAVPPLLRLTLIRIADQEWICVKTHHHVVMDAWSGSIVLREMQEVYQTLRRRQNPKLLPAPPYRPYIDWLRRQDLSAAERFWRAQLEGISAPTPVPAEASDPVPLPPADRFLGHRLTLSPSATSALQSLALRWRVTVSTLVHAAWALLLSQWSGEVDVVFGMTTSGRPPDLDGVERTVGLFINALPMRVRIEPELSLKVWLCGLNARTAEMRSYEYASPAQLHSWSGLPGGVPLFESLITYNSAAIGWGDLRAGATRPGPPASSVGVGGGRLRELVRPDPTNHPLSATVSEAGESLIIDLTADGHRVAAGAPVRLLEQLRTLLETFPAHPEARVGDLSVLSGQERQRILRDWNAARIEVPRGLCLHQLFEASARRTPGATAVLFQGRAHTFAELNEAANRLAHHLRSQGVGPEVLVGLDLERSPDLLVAMLAVLKSGGGYVPLDRAYPEARRRFMLENSRVSVVLTDAETPADHDLPTIRLGRDDDLWRDASRLDPLSDVRPENVAFVMYTSGSTGGPKGVVVPHSVCVNRLHVEADPLAPDDVLCCRTSLNFIDSVWETFAAWAGGLPTVLVPPDRMGDPERLVTLLADAGVTRVVLVPSLLRAMLESGAATPERLPRLQYWISSGEALPRDLSKLFVESFPDRLLTNLYGTTETWDVTRHDTRAYPPEESLPIGRPMANSTAYVLDRRLQPLPVGAAGELYVGGAGLARGYHRRPALTAERFLPDPYGEQPGARLYRTGDRARWRSDGNLELLGRVDHQVKVRGFRVEPEEVEAVLRMHRGIQRAAVVTTSRQQLAAYVVAAGSECPSAAELRQHVRVHLPAHMVPTVYEFLDELPSTPSGKLDRRALPAVAGEESRLGDPPPPEGPLAGAIAAVWSEVLGVRDVGADSNFFDLGGHSLLATQVTARLRASLGRDIPLRALFEAPTVNGLAAWLEATPAEPQTDDLPELGAVAPVAAGAHRVAPQSYAQQRMWFLAQLAPGSTLYTTRGTVPLPSSLDLDALQRALDALLERHESLRTTFTATADGELVQMVGPAAPVRLAVRDLRGLPPDHRRAAVQRWARAEGALPFDLARGPLVRFTLLWLDKQQFLAFSMHHIVTDGWSMGVLRREVLALYEAFRAARPSPLEPLPLQYADFANWQRDVLQGSVLDRHLDYWRGVLSGADRPQLPTDRPRPPVPSYRSERHTFTLGAEQVARLQELSRAEGATLFMTLLAVFTFVIGRYSGQQDVVVGTPIANRTRAELENLIGLFVNTLVMRTDLSGKPTFRQLLRRVREVCVGAYAHQDLPFEKLVEELSPQRDLAAQPLFQVLFVLQNATQPADVVPQPTGEPANTLDVAGLIYFDITLSLAPTASGLTGELHYNTDLFDRGTTERIAAQFQTLVRAVAEAPDAPLSGTMMLSSEERERLLSDWSGSRSRVPERCLHHVVEEQVDRDPDHPAVLFGTRRLSYGELDRSANRLARRLSRSGVGPETPVALYMDRTPEALIGLLAILKAGGAYVPLDPDSPAERLTWLLNDVRPTAVLCDRRLAPTLPAAPTPVVVVDVESAPADCESDSRPKPAIGPTNLAYIVYTSGSTGRPKGVLVEHRNAAHTIQSQIPVFGLTPASRVLATIAWTFDASLGEIFRTLAAGATLCLTPREAILPGPGIPQLWRSLQIDTCTLASPVLAAVPAELDVPGLKTLTVGGEALPAELAAQWRRGRRLLNGYGPTETAIGATVAEEWPSNRRPPLGRPLPGVRAYVLDADLELQPEGVPGELYLAGPGVTRGYLRRPDLSADRFVPDPFGGDPGGRMYRTGDRVRWSHDGQLDFLGRVDDQVKVRGHRVEPEEIAAVLRHHESVRDCAVVVQPGPGGEQRLVAYVVSAGAEAGETSEDVVADWQRASEVAAAAVAAADVEDPRLNFTGWTDSATGLPIPQEEMVAWVESTAEHIRSLRPRRVLDLGCGSGLLLFRLAPSCEYYLGVDFSAGLLEHVRRHLALLSGDPCQVDLRQRRADELEDVPDASFDCVVINSVVQYFPDVDYATRVLAEAVRVVRPGGHVFVGDVRNLRLLEAFHGRVELTSAPATLSIDRVLRRVLRHRFSERELVLDPALFTHLSATVPRVSHVQVMPKRGTAHNELTAFRYDVVLHVEGPSPLEPSTPWRTWTWPTRDAGLRALRQELETSEADVGIRAVPNARTAAHAAALSLLHAGEAGWAVADLRRQVLSTNEGVEPEDLVALGESVGREVELSWLECDDAGRYAVLFRMPFAGVPPTAFPDAPGRVGQYGNQPARVTDARQWTNTLRDHLRARLPEHMIPASIVRLDALPLTSHGKLDRAALPPPDTDRERTRSAEYVAPRSHAERLLAGIWSELLGVERVGINDNFFELGGDSILSVRVIARANEAGLQLTTQDVYRLQTVAEQAAASRKAPAVVVDQGPVVGPIPLTPIQHWFLEGDDPCPDHFNWAAVLPAPAGLGREKAEQALLEILRHHDALRLRVTRSASGDWRQVLVEPCDDDPPLVMVDLSDRAPGEQRAAIEAHVADLQTSLDLAHGPLLRLAWFRLGRRRPDPLVLIVHHMAVDTVSWPILLGDLTTLLQWPAEDEPMRLPPKTTSIKEWAEHLVAAAHSDSVLAELPLWVDQRRRDVAPLPRDHDALNSRASARDITAGLTVDETTSLLAALRAQSCTVEDVLLTALARTLSQWAGTDRALIDVERHGREDLGAEIDLSRTVGWLPMLVPVLVDLPRERPTPALLAVVHRQLLTLPRRGVGHGLLRYLSENEVRRQLREMPRPEVFFCYHGQQRGRADEETTSNGDWPLDLGPLISSEGLRRHLFEVNAVVSRGRLQIRWSYCSTVHEQATADALLRSCLLGLREIAAGTSEMPDEGDAPSRDQTITRHRV